MLFSPISLLLSFTSHHNIANSVSSLHLHTFSRLFNDSAALANFGLLTQQQQQQQQQQQRYSTYLSGIDWSSRKITIASSSLA
jgi:isocitrate lyase